MTGIISYDLFTMRKKISAYVCLLLPSAFICLFALLASKEGTRAMIYEMYSFGTVPLLLCDTVFFALFSGNDLKKGSIKNVAGSLPERMTYVLSKALTLTLYALASAGLLLLTCVILSGGKLNAEGGLFSTGDFVRCAALHALGLIAFMFTVLFVCVLTGSTSGTVVFAVIYSTNLLAGMLYSLLELLMVKLNIEFDFSKISLSQQFQMMTPLADSKQSWNMLIVCAVYILLFGTLSCIVFRRKDIA